MPSNVITINNHAGIDEDDLAWVVGDSKMELLIVLLNAIGSKYEVGVSGKSVEKK